MALRRRLRERGCIPPVSASGLRQPDGQARGRDGTRLCGPRRIRPPAVPEIVTRARTWPVLGVFLSVLAGYTVISAFLVRRRPVTRSGLTCGLGLAAVWVIAGIPLVTRARQPAGSLLLLAIPVASLAVGAAAARRRGTAAVRQHVVL